MYSWNVVYALNNRRHEMVVNTVGLPEFTTYESIEANVLLHGDKPIPGKILYITFIGKDKKH